jgi:hypothetical protein
VSFRAICCKSYEPVIYWVCGFELWCAILNLWLWIMVCNAKQVVVNLGVSCRASGCESYGVKLSQWLWIMVCNSEPVVVNHGLLCYAKCCKSWCDMLSKWLWIIRCYACESWWVILSQWLWNMVCYAVPVVGSHGELCCARGVNHDMLCWAGGCES